MAMELVFCENPGTAKNLVTVRTCILLLLDPRYHHRSLLCRRRRESTACLHKPATTQSVPHQLHHLLLPEKGDSNVAVHFETLALSGRKGKGTIVYIFLLLSHAR